MIHRLIYKLNYLFKKHFLKDPFIIAHSQWIQNNGDETLRLQYNLNKDSLVFDLGGFHGDFTEKIYALYQCNVYIFEPVKSHYTYLIKKFLNNSKVNVFPYGLSSRNEKVQISLSNDASSIYKQKEELSEEIELKSITEFFVHNEIDKIDLMKINIEGGEYDLLQELIQTNLITKISNIQIQFHDFMPTAKEKRESIRSALHKTHLLTYDYYFIWESWSKK